MANSMAPFSHENALVRVNAAGDFEGCGENLARLDNYGLEVRGVEISVRIVLTVSYDKLPKF
jgi:hypothetical protein